MPRGADWVRKKMVPKIRFWRDGGTIDVPVGTTLLAAARRAGAPLGNSCRGRGICRACTVLVVRGDELLCPRRPCEDALGITAPWRMACQARPIVAANDQGEDHDVDEGEVVLHCMAWGGDPAEVWGPSGPDDC